MAHFFYSKMDASLEKIEEVLSPLAESLGCEILTCEWTQEMGRKILRVYLDKPAGITIDDCEKFSHLANPVLDVEDLVSSAYDLEISSPGINRPLKKAKHFEKVLGKMIRVKTFGPIEGRSRYKGILLGIEKGILNIEIDKQEFKVPLEEIEKANLEVSVDEVLKKGKKK